MTAASQLDVIKKDTRIFVTVADIAPILKADPLYLRETARQAPEALGFPVCVVGRRVKIPRVPFLRFCGVDDAGHTHK